MSVDINVYLRNKGGTTTRAQSKMSAKKTFQNKRGKISASEEKKSIGNMGALATFMSSGNIAKSSLMKVPVLRSVMAALKVADKAVNFTTAIYQARSGEQMRSNNFRAASKLATSLGTSYIGDYIDNILYREPQIQRQNYMLDYGRDLYMRNIENEKNKFS